MDKLGDAVQLCGDLCAYAAAEIHTNTAGLHKENIQHLVKMSENSHDMYNPLYEFGGHTLS